ncbi:GNAT family N-acetyltransferase [Pseudomonas aeruginosa]|uniref:GNAT family N-acetyltransferase n=1 Tax=Pseudomonas aeruginosa TaxID=287 RepID=UPI00117B130C|nr:GNAT family N-acetyltransferase [Pseudomonas aeruginosa]MUI84134.1 GNAT family N-acetyltransferase [Pseudomonas aeruginosa]
MTPTRSNLPKRRRPAKETPKPRIVKPKIAAAKVSPNEVQLISVAGTQGKGKGPGGEKWRIEVGGIRAGEIFINVIDEPPIGRHASLQIYLNIKSQGRGIGRVAYAKACSLSAHDIIYAHMRRSNIASRTAAQVAGFIDATPTGFTQLILCWVRLKTDSRPT